MFSKEMGRRKFMKNMSSAFLGVVTSRFCEKKINGDVGAKRNNV